MIFVFIIDLPKLILCSCNLIPREFGVIDLYCR